jgi:hypothetical protein
MNFECKKTEDCFANSRTYEYRLPITAQEFSVLLKDWSVRVNSKLRRPVFVAERDGLNVKGILLGNTIRASFPQERWETEKASFEHFLEETNV